MFDRYTKEEAQQFYRLLVLNGHASHVTMNSPEYCDQHKILVAILSLHLIYTLYLLDVSMFKPFSTTYYNDLSVLLERSQGLSLINKGDFFSLFWKAWVGPLMETTILKSFEATGILPLKPDVICQRVINTAPEGQESQESSSLVLNT